MVQRVVAVFEEIEEEKSQSSSVLTAKQQQSLDAFLDNLAHVFLHTNLSPSGEEGWVYQNLCGLH